MVSTNNFTSVEDNDIELLDESFHHHSSIKNDQPKLTYIDAFALLVSLQIGSGIFSSPASIDKNTPGPGYAVIIWLLSGFLAWTGAACYAELGSALPISGGTQEYLKYIYGDGPAFMASWMWIMAVKPSGMAALTITFAQYWTNTIFASNIATDGWQTKLLAITAFALVVFFNMLSMEATMKMTKFFFILKLSTLLLLLFCTLASLFFGLHSADAPLTHDWLDRNWFSVTNLAWQSGVWNSTGSYTIAIYAGLWAYSGWDNANVVAGDMSDSARDLPKAIHTAQPVVICSFVMASICYYMTLPWNQISETNTIAVTVGRNVLGWLGSLSFAALVSLACLGSVSVNVFTNSRLVISAAQAGWLPGSLGKFTTAPFAQRQSTLLTSSNDTPVRAMLFNFCLSIIYITLGTFESLITFIGLAEYAFFGATAIGLLLLRVREPALSRPYKANIVVAAIFGVVSFFLVICGSIKAPKEATVLVVMVVIMLAQGLVRRHGGIDVTWMLKYKKRRDSHRY